ncbi:MAG: magnesium transporter [Burkholderiales bacterium]
MTASAAPAAEIHSLSRAESVAAHVVANVPRAAHATSAATVLAMLRDGSYQNTELILVTEDTGRLAGVVPLARLNGLDPESPIGSALAPSFPLVRGEEDQERAASIALHHRVDALPVIDIAGRALGVLPAQVIMQVLRREHVEDLHRLAGIRHESAQARHAIDDSPLRRVRHRLPWLLVGLVGSGVATAAMARFESVLQANVAVAFFVPAIVYLADAIGTQSEAIAVRGLSLTRAGIGRLVAGELRAGLLIGLALGLCAFPAVQIAFGNWRLSVAVACAILAAGCVAAVMGLSLPWVFARLRRDPALGAGPIGTIVQDVLSLLVYFEIVRLFEV